MRHRLSVTALRRGVALCILASLCFLPLGWPALAAELHLRESLLAQQRDRVSIDVDGTIAKIGPVHDLDTTKPMSGDDCDVHMGISSTQIRVPFVGEIKNACSTVPPSGNSWSRSILAERNSSGVAKFTGAFRLWLEHPPAGSRVQTEAKPDPVNGSNPDHQVELHPLLQIGQIDVRPNVRWVEKNGKSGFGYGPTQLRDALSWKITVQKISYRGTPYIKIAGPKFKYNHWTLTARALGQPEPIGDGVRLKADIVNTRGTPIGRNIVLQAAVGTPGGTKLARLTSGDTFEFLALSTMDIATLLDEAKSRPREIPVPLAFIVLDTR